MAFADLLTPAAATYRAITGTDGDGAFVLGTAVVIAAYVDKAARRVRDERGEEKVARTIVTTNVEIPEDCILWLAGQTESQGKKPIYVDSSPNPRDTSKTIWEAGL